MKHRILFLCLLALLFVNCCPITSVHPLKPHADETMTGLSGIWQLESREDKVFLHIGRSEQKQWRILLAEHKEDGTLAHADFGVTTASIAQKHYMNLDLAELSPSLREGHEGNVILEVALTDGYTLHLSRMNLDAIASAIGAGALAGEIIYDDTAVSSAQNEKKLRGRKIQCARITADSAALRGFLSRSTDPGLFTPYLTFKRVACIP